MTRFLSAEWFELRARRADEADLPARAGASARVQHVVTGAPEGEVRYFETIEDGRLTACAPGELADAGMTWTETYADAVGIMSGKVDAGAAFMAGRAKVAGSMGEVLTLLALLATAEYRDLGAGVASATDPPEVPAAPPPGGRRRQPTRARSTRASADPGTA